MESPETPNSSGKFPEQHLPRLGVLVVDDEHMVRAMLQRGLEWNGFEVFLAGNAAEAIQIYRDCKEQIAVALLDVRLPERDGPQILSDLRQLNPEIIACFMSGNPGDYDLEDLLGHGAALVISKPFRLEQLAKVLRQLVHGVPGELLPPGNLICQG